MTAMSTALTEFSDSPNARTYTLPAHTVQAPRLVNQKRTVPSTPSGVAEDSVRVVYGTTDSEDAPLAAKVSFEAVVRRPVNGDAADVAAALAIYREIVASDEFAATVLSQNYLK